MTEETHDASRAGPRGIVMSIVVSVVAGWVLLIGLTFAIQSYDSALDSPTGVPPGADLHRRGRRHRRQAAAAHRDRRPAVLRHGVGDRELADDLRLLPRRRAAGLARLAPDQPAHPDADQRHLAGRRRRVRPGPALPVERRPRTPRSPRSRSSASTSPTCCRRSCGCARATRSSPGRGTSAGGAGRSASIAVVWVAFITVLFMLPQVSPVSVGDLQLHAGRRARRPRLRRHLVAGLGEELVHRARRCRARPEELAAAERELESLA